jgi:hypothetical protein
MIEGGESFILKITSMLAHWALRRGSLAVNDNHQNKGPILFSVKIEKIEIARKI